MIKQFAEMFYNHDTAEKIKAKLPVLFTIAEKESSRAGKIGMQVGSMRENILISLLIWKFGEENVKTDLPITTSEVDVLVNGSPLSIKTVTGNALVKLIWTDDPQKTKSFIASYSPACDMLLAKIVWQSAEEKKSEDSSTGGLYFISVGSQHRVYEQLKDRYFKIPKKGTNARGLGLSPHAFDLLLHDAETLKLDIVWKKGDLNHNIYKRWIEYWEE